MQVKLIVTNNVVDDERRFNVYRLYDNDTLLGECYTSRKYNYILGDGVTISIEDRSPWYQDTDICFYDVASGNCLGSYNDHKPAFTIGGEYWVDTAMEHIERSIWKPSAWLKFAPHAWVHEDKQFFHAVAEIPPREKPWGPYIASRGTFHTNGLYILPMLVSCYIMAEKDYRSD